jgi:hypothetical protein
VVLGSACSVCCGGWVLHRHQPPSLRHPFFRLTHKCLRRFLFSPVPSLFPPRYHTCGLVGLVGLGVAAMCVRMGRRKRTGTSTSLRWSPPTAICTSRAGTTRSRANGRGAYRRQVSETTSDIRILRIRWIRWYTITVLYSSRVLGSHRNAEGNQR